MKHFLEAGQYTGNGCFTVKFGLQFQPCLISENSNVKRVLSKSQSIGIFLSCKKFTFAIFSFCFSITYTWLTLAF